MSLLNDISKKVEEKLSKNIKQLDSMIKSYNSEITKQAENYINKIIKLTANPMLEKLSDAEYDVLCKEIDFEKKSIAKMMQITAKEDSYIYTLCYISNKVCNYCKSYKNQMNNDSTM